MNTNAMTTAIEQVAAILNGLKKDVTLKLAGKYNFDAEEALAYLETGVVSSETLTHPEAPPEDATKANIKSDLNVSEPVKITTDAPKQKKEKKTPAVKMTPEEKEAAKEAAKQAKQAEKEAAKEAAKQAKQAEKEAAKEAAKQAKQAEKEAAKQAKQAEKGAAKAAEKNTSEKVEEKVVEEKVVEEKAVEEKAVEEKAVEDQDELSEDEVDEDEEESVTLKGFTYEGKKYGRSEDGTVFDLETQEEIGTWDEEAQKIVFEAEDWVSRDVIG